MVLLNKCLLIFLLMAAQPAVSAIYGENNEKSAAEISDKKIKSNLSSVAIIYRKDKGFGRGKGNIGTGTIFLHSGKKYLLTNHHVFEEASSCSNLGVVANYNAFAMIESANFVDLPKIREFLGFGQVKTGSNQYTSSEYVKMVRFIGNGQLPIVTGHSPEHECSKVIVSNKKLDFSLIKISDPVLPKTHHETLSDVLVGFDKIPEAHRGNHLPYLSAKDFSNDFETNEFQVYNLNHTDGQSLRWVDKCKAGIGKTSSGFFLPYSGYQIKHTCDGSGGSSGSLIFRSSDSKPIGLHSSGIKDIDYLNQTKLPDEISMFSKSENALYLPLIIPALIEKIENPYTTRGIFSFSGNQWTSLDGRIFLESYLRSSSKLIKVNEVLSFTEGAQTELATVVKIVEELVFENSSVITPKEINISILDNEKVYKTRSRFPFVNLKAGHTHIKNRLKFLIFGI